MRGFQEEISMGTQKTIEEYTNMIIREKFVKNYPYAFSIALEALGIYGVVPQIIRTAKSLIEEHVKEVLYYVPYKKGDTDNNYGRWFHFEIRCNKKYDITNDWIIDTAISRGFKKIRRDSIKDKNGMGIDYVRIESLNGWGVVNNYTIVQSETDTKVVVCYNHQRKMLQAIGYGLINLAIRESNK